MQFQAGLFHTASLIAIFVIMASQDLISQFTQASPMIPASQPDRSRTPRRPHQEWHQSAPTFRGPMHYACHGCICTSNTTSTSDIILPFTAFMDNFPVNYVIPTYTTCLASWTTGLQFLYTSTMRNHYTKITTVHDHTAWRLPSSSWLHLSPDRHSTGRWMETGR